MDRCKRGRADVADASKEFFCKNATEILSLQDETENFDRCFCLSVKLCCYFRLKMLVLLHFIKLSSGGGRLFSKFSNSQPVPEFSPVSVDGSCSNLMTACAVAVTEGNSSGQLRTGKAVVAATCGVTLNSTAEDALTQLNKLRLVRNSVQCKIIVDGGGTSCEALDNSIVVNFVQKGSSTRNE